MKYNRFDFLQDEWPGLFKITQQIENNIVGDPDIAFIKMRQLVEFMVKDVLEAKRDSEASSLDLKRMIEEVGKLNIMPLSLLNKLDLIRKYGNKSVHSNYSDFSNVLAFYDYIFDMCCWYISNFGKRYYKEYVVHLCTADKVVLMEYLLDEHYHSGGESSMQSEQTNRVDHEWSSYTAQFQVLSFDEYTDLLEGLDVKQLKRTANSNVVEAQFLMGWMTYYGIRMDHADHEGGLRWLEKASKGGFELASEQLAYLLFENGEDARALALLNRLAEQGKELDASVFGQLLLKHANRLEDYEKAFSYLNRVSDWRTISWQFDVEQQLKTIFLAAKTDETYTIAQQTLQIWFAATNFYNREYKLANLCKEVIEQSKNEQQCLDFMELCKYIIEQNVPTERTYYSALGKVLSEQTTYPLVKKEGGKLLGRF